VETADVDGLVAELTLSTPRLLLRPYTTGTAQAVIDGDREGQAWSPGFPRDDDRDIALMVVASESQDRMAFSFGPRQMIDRETGLVVGALGFFGPPAADGRLTLGYGVAAEVEGRGLTTEAVRALIAYGWEQPEVTHIWADTEPANIGSQRVMQKAGMTRVPSEGSLYAYAIRRPEESRPAPVARRASSTSPVCD
jgi:RimJ/RimL family protein N-acetyltransferase